MKNSKNYSQLTRTTYLDIFFMVHCFFKPSVTFWYGAPVVYVQSLRAGRHQKLLVFALNNVTLLQIPCHSLFLWIWLCDIKITNGKVIFNSLPSRKLYFIVIFNFQITVLKARQLRSTAQQQKLSTISLALLWK